MEEPIIHVKDVYKTYQMGSVKVRALRGLDMEIYKGDFAIIMGPSGSGKSTAMAIVGCLDLPTKGHVFLEGTDISKLGESELAQIRGKKIGFVFQKFNLIETLTALENIMLPMTFQGKTESEKRKKAKELLNIVGLGNRINHKPSELSGGEQQRVAIARSLANDPDIILADEPTGNLDTEAGNKVMQFIHDIYKKDGKTIIIVTHDVHLTKFIKERKLYKLRDGRIVR